MRLLTPAEISPTEKLHLLRRLDRFRRWGSLDDERQCLQCGKLLRGRDIEVLAAEPDSGALQLQCPTARCPAIPIDWIVPKNTNATRQIPLPPEVPQPTDAGMAKLAHPPRRAVLSMLLHNLLPAGWRRASVAEAKPAAR